MKRGVSIDLGVCSSSGASSSDWAMAKHKTDRRMVQLSWIIFEGLNKKFSSN